MRAPHRLIASLLAAAALATVAAPANAARTIVRVFAASSLTDVMTEAGRIYEAQTGRAVKVAVASTSTLARQLAAGAEADVFVSADTRWMDWLAARRLVDTASVTVVARNELVAIAPAGTARPLDVTQRAAWAAIVKKGRIAIGDPLHVPAGHYAKAALVSLGAWEVVAGRVVAADNVRSALALVERGEVPAGIVYATDARITKGVTVIGRFPSASHPAIVYPAAVVSTSRGSGAADFLAFLKSAKAAAVFAKFGFATK